MPENLQAAHPTFILPTESQMNLCHQTRKRLFEKHSLLAVFSMPNDIFDRNASAPVCVMVWKAHRPHDSAQETFFGYYKNDGFVKRKKLGRIDAYKTWNDIQREWLRLYRNRDVKDGVSARFCVKDTDEWLCEAYMKTDYSLLSKDVFSQSVRDYLSFQIKCGLTDLSIKTERHIAGRTESQDRMAAKG